jgi:hypothetical protein
LELALAKYHLAQATAAPGTSRLTIAQENCLWGSYKLLLSIAAMQISDGEATEAEKATIARMQAHCILPPAPWDTAAFGAPPSPPRAPGTPSLAEGATAAGTSSKRSKPTKWWLQPDDADWRKSAWTRPVANRTRTIKVRGNKNEGWIELPDVAVREFLTWYDHAELFDEKKGVVTDFDRNHAYDYRFEGGKWLSQRNPNHPESNPREVQVLYSGAPPEDGNW